MGPPSSFQTGSSTFAPATESGFTRFRFLIHAVHADGIRTVGSFLRLIQSEDPTFTRLHGRGCPVVGTRANPLVSIFAVVLQPIDDGDEIADLQAGAGPLDLSDLGLHLTS